jgi:hypothetical protein
MKIIESISRLNNANFGSFGEYIFEYQNSSQKIERKHSESIDFVLNGKNIDVKSIRRFKEGRTTPKKYSGRKLNNIEYAYTQFYSNIVICSIEGEVQFTLDYPHIEKLFKKWCSRSEAIAPPAKKMSNEYKDNLNNIKGLISKFFLNLKLKPRIIYRTCQKGFGKESPGNLIPIIKEDNSVTVYIIFKDHKISENNIEQIIFFMIKSLITYRY